ncbi:MAG: CPBP family intramembrane metalloprotease [Chloroflexi bacterium]|nr:CPBP family intramembrane metalloprotease [Chloroflexota bacterium]
MLEQKLDQAPWTIQETFLGIFFTLVPWIAFALLLSSINVKSKTNVVLSPQVDLTRAIIVFLFSTLIEGAFLVAPFYFASRAYRNTNARGRLTLQALGFRSFDVGSALFWIGGLILAFFAINGLYQDVITMFHLHLQTNDQYILEQSKNAPISTYATLLASVLIAPFCEEVFFRGFVFMGLLRGMPPAWAIVLSSLIFAVAHADPGSFAVLFLIGLALAFLRWRTHSIWPSMILHLLNNGIGALLIVLVMQKKL